MAEQTSKNTVALIGILSLSSWFAGCSSAGPDLDATEDIPTVGAAATDAGSDALPVATQSSDTLAALVPIPSSPDENTATDTETQPTDPTPVENEEEETSDPTQPTFPITPTPLPEEEDETDLPFEPEPEPEPEPLPEPLPEPEPGSPPAVAACSEDIKASTLYLINQARSQARVCGNQSFGAANPLTWNNKLEAAALSHSNDMATHNFFSHTGSDGSSSSARASAAGYNWRTVGENIAAGQSNTQVAIQAWIDSPGHCANLMNPSFEEVAVACVEDQGSQYRVYWTNMLGAEF